MKKKLLTALLVGAMALNITACGGSSDAAAPADNDQQTTTTDTASDDAADTEEDAVDVEDAAEEAVEPQAARLRASTTARASVTSLVKVLCFMFLISFVVIMIEWNGVLLRRTPPG